MSINTENFKLQIERSYTPAELVELLDIPMEKILEYFMEEVYDHIDIFKDLIIEVDNEEETKT
tara:strand:- start:1467 stop:1655 length:189 start_codon:yes stop_codon:yes gene_type:complete